MTSSTPVKGVCARCKRGRSVTLTVIPEIVGGVRTAQLLYVCGRCRDAYLDAVNIAGPCAAHAETGE